jgi:hypothetical protein
MIMTMLGGFFAGVCADATPPNASGTASIAAARKLRLIIDISFHLPFAKSACQSTSRRLASLRKKRANNGALRVE